MRKPLKVKQKLLTYIAEKSKGATGKQAALAAGYSPAVAGHHIARLESSNEYKTASEAFAASLSKSFRVISGKDPLVTLGDALVETSIQDKDKAARLKAVELALSYFGINANQPVQSNNLIVIGLGGGPINKDGYDEKGQKIIQFRG